MPGSNQFSRPPVAFNVAGPAKVGAAGPTGPQGPAFSQSVTLINGTAAGTITLSPAIGQDVVIAMPATGGTVTLNVGTVAARQRVLIDIINGATVGTIAFQAGSTIAAGFIGSTSLPLANYSGSVANTTDNLSFIAPGTVAGNTNLLRLEAINQGFVK